MNYGYMDSFGWGGMAFGGLAMVFWLALMVGLIVLVVRWLGGSPVRSDRRGALNTLEQRFASGEIDTPEFEERSRQLR